MSKALLAICVFAAIASAEPCLAQSDLVERLSIERLGSIQPGAYVAGDRIHFTIGAFGGNYLLRFDGDPEVFALYADRTSLGGRILKYDSGETAIRTASWGGITLYTDGSPNGLPAVRSGDAAVPQLPVVSVSQMQAVAGDESEHLAYARRLRVIFTADWSVLETSSALRSTALDALENAARGIERFTHASAGRETISDHVTTVTLATAMRPTLRLYDKTLIVTFNPDRGYFGRASSRAIARALMLVLPASKR
ncbi:MAG TPA: DUF4908 domain-containing protein [Rhizomicrobium sp.]|nr:DUF4908 domain-containing protein [Rhizomicrobium sp.]